MSVVLNLFKVSDIDQHVEKLMLKITSGGLTTTKVWLLYEKLKLYE